MPALKIANHTSPALAGAICAVRRVDHALPILCLVAAVVVVPLGCDRTRTPPPSSSRDSGAVAEPFSVAENEAADDGEQNSTPPRFDVNAAKVRADDLAQRGELEAAASTLQEILLVDPGEVDVLFALARLEAARGNLSEAVSLLEGIAEDHPRAGLAALGQSADWCVQLQRYAEAESRYLKILTRVPDAGPAHRQLAYLLNRQGRRHEAARHVRELCRLGDVRQDELHSLISLSSAIYDDPSQPAAENTRPYWPIGASGEARRLVNQEKYEQAIAKLHAQVASGEAPAAVVAMFGRAAAEAQDDARFHWWLSKIDDSVREHADYWAAIAAFELSQRRFKQATRALGEAIDRDPTDLVSMARMRQALTTLGDKEAGKRWLDRWNAIHEMVDVNNRIAKSDPPDTAAISELADRLEQLDRPLEALLWRSIQEVFDGATQSELVKWNERRQDLVRSGTAFPSRDQRLCGIDLNRYPLPQRQPLDATKSASGTRKHRHKRCSSAHFKNVAEEVGLDHTYHVASQPQRRRFSIYQTLGGGVAVLDYDCDGACDLYLAQGGADPPSFRGTRSNQLFRQVDLRLTDVSRQAAAEEFRYSIGLTAGDWNQDGFPDLVIASIGGLSLKINQGDGTFSDHPIAENVDIHKVPASAAMADANQDGIPELVQTFYVDDPTMLVKPPVDESGRVLQTVSPNNFDPGADWLIENDGKGGFVIKELSRQGVDAGTGLGIVVTDFDRRPGNEIFVGNDSLPNQLWVHDPTSGEFSDVASLIGCAYGFSGGMTGAMGIAAGDFDENGTLDLHVTNYENENASLFLKEHGSYQDRNVQFRLGADSKGWVGFGTQAIDYDNDGWLDLVVSNGHIEDAITIGGGFAQPPQLFCNAMDRFELIEVVDPSNYWNSKHVGRGLAKLDFDRDGREDMAVTHIGRPTALLLNQTSTKDHWLQIRLVGTVSGRDAIGTRLRIRLKSRELSRWVTAGDGYLSSNEQVVFCGLGSESRVEELTITWPSGAEQTLHDVAADRRLLVVENQPGSFDLGWHAPKSTEKN